MTSPSMPAASRWIRQRPRTDVGARAATADPAQFHATMPGFTVTPTVTLADLALALGIGQVVVKHEAERLGLPAYKVLGGSWALHEAVRRRLPAAPPMLAWPALAAAIRTLAPVTLVTATDGNHGRGIAALAERLGVQAHITVPHDMIAERIAMIRGHGATVTVADGGYDDAVQLAAALAATHGWWLCADTATDAPHDAAAPFAQDVQTGYHTLYAELWNALPRDPDLLLVQAGVGALAASAATFLTSRAASTRLVVVEPIGSACVLASLRADAPTRVADDFSVMAGLRAQAISAVAWPLLRARADAAVAIDDPTAIRAMALLAHAGLESGESGAAGLGGLLAIAADPETRAALGLTPRSLVACVITEGRTDPTAAARLAALA